MRFDSDSGGFGTAFSAFAALIAVFVATTFLATPLAAHSAPTGWHSTREWFAAAPADKGSDEMRNLQHWKPAAIALGFAAAAFTASFTGCGGDDDNNTKAPVTVGAGTANTVSRWDEIAASTINQPAAASGTEEEMQPIYAFDLATLHIAMYDAVIAIDGHYKPFAITPTSPSAGASPDAAATAAAYGVLKGLFPSRSATYQAGYDEMLGNIADGSSKTRGIAVGAEVAAKVLKLRAHDGRATVLKPFVPGTQPGDFRGPAIVGRAFRFVRPFTLTSTSQFRAPGPNALTSETYAKELNEAEALGSAASTTRTEAQNTIARFHTEAPSVFWPRNLRPFMMTGGTIADQARIAAVIWVAHADATIACFESKYHHLAWRPFSAINLADTDGNDATTADPTWVPYMPTPPHPEYPAAHGCAGGAGAASVSALFGTGNVAFRFSSTVTSTTHRYDTTDALVDDITTARIAGGMHFRHSVEDGAALGRKVADWVLSTHFQRR